MKRDIKLYNLIFPMWGIYFYAILFPYFLCFCCRRILLWIR